MYIFTCDNKYSEINETITIKVFKEGIDIDDKLSSRFIHKSQIMYIECHKNYLNFKEATGNYKVLLRFSDSEENYQTCKEAYDFIMKYLFQKSEIKEDSLHLMYS